MTVIISRPAEHAQVTSIGVGNVYVTPSERFSSTMSNTATNRPGAPAASGRAVSVDSTIQFIRAHYDSLFRRLAD